MPGTRGSEALDRSGGCPRAVRSGRIAMSKVRLATFNVENLFARYRFKSNADPETAIRDGWDVNKTRFDIHEPAAKKITASAIKALKADVVALQEVENLDALKRFRNMYLGGRTAYPHAVVVDGNDPRLIDVAVLSRYPLRCLQTHQHLWHKPWKYYLFSRDCLELDVVLPGGKSLALFVNHFKSMMDGRAKTREKRLKQAAGVKKIVKDRFGSKLSTARFAILGDFNDYPEKDPDGTTSGIRGLAGWSEVVDVVRRLPPGEQWTHYYKKKKAYRQLDYLLLSRALAADNPHPPHIERRGLPTRAARYTGARFSGVGKDKPKASDHCAVVMDLNL